LGRIVWIHRSGLEQQSEGCLKQRPAPGGPGVFRSLLA
jgi:hypothetical protein